MTGVAVKVTDEPAQTGLADVAIDTPTVNNGLTVMVTVLDVAGFPVVHAALEVMAQVMTFPFTGIKAYDEFVAPVTDVPFNFH